MPLNAAGLWISSTRINERLASSPTQTINRVPLNWVDWITRACLSISCNCIVTYRSTIHQLRHNINYVFMCCWKFTWTLWAIKCQRIFFLWRPCCPHILTWLQVEHTGIGRMASQFRKWRLSENNVMRALMRPAALAELLRSGLRNPRKSPGLCWNSSDHGGPASHHTGLRDVRHHRETLEVSCPCLDHWEPSVIHDRASMDQTCPRKLDQTQIWGIWKPDRSLELFVTVLGSFLSSLCGAGCFMSKNMMSVVLLLWCYYGVVQLLFLLTTTSWLLNIQLFPLNLSWLCCPNFSHSSRCKKSSYRRSCTLRSISSPLHHNESPAALI